MNRAVYASSATDNWETPKDLFDRLDAVHHFTLDVCADVTNAKCDKFYTKEQNGLSQPWYGVVWMNPPYGKTISMWMRKAYEVAKRGEATVVCLVPARTDTTWWHDYAMKGQIEFIRGRLKFGGAKHGAPFPSAIVVFEKKERKAEEVVRT